MANQRMFSRIAQQLPPGLHVGRMLDSALACHRFRGSALHYRQGGVHGKPPSLSLTMKLREAIEKKLETTLPIPLPIPWRMSRRDLAEYVVSLPERVVRSATALGAGIVREVGETTLPASIRRTQLYRSMVDLTLRFLIEDVGQVKGVFPVDGRLSEDFLLRRTAGNGIEAIGLLTFRASPVWVFAAIADVTGAGKVLIREIAEALHQDGLIESTADIEDVDTLLQRLERGSGRLAETFNTPPLDVVTLREELRQIRAEFTHIPKANLPDAETVVARWHEITEEAKAQNRTVFQISSLIAFSAVSQIPENLRWLGRSAKLAAAKAGHVFAMPILNHYSDTLRAIHKTGFLQYWIQEFRPYIRGALEQFSTEHDSFTQRFLHRNDVKDK